MSGMVQKRNRSRPSLSLQQRLALSAQLARDRAALLQDGEAKEALLQNATDSERAAAIENWLATPLKPDKRDS